MSPDRPFRAFDRIDPPDQWDEIARRTADTDTDVVVDLDDVRLRRPRRRAVGLVAAAAVIALVAGGLVATTDDGDEDGVATTPSTTQPGRGMPGPCPFTVDPGPPERVVTPGRTPVEVPGALVEMLQEEPSLAETLDLTPWTTGSWGTTTFEGTPLTVTVYGDGGTDLTPLGPFTDVAIVDDARGKELLITGTSVIEGSDPCRTVQVSFRAGLTDADASARRAAMDTGEEDDEGVVDLDPYFEEHDDLVNRALGAVRLTEGAPEVPDPCTELIDPDDPPVPATITPEPPRPYSFGGELADGRPFTVEVRDEDGEPMAWIEVEGDEGGGGGSLPSGPGDQNWSFTGDDSGLVVGWHPPGSVATAAVRPDGTLATEGLVLSPGGSLFALPDVGQSLDASGEQETWPVVHCDADGEPIGDPRYEVLPEGDDPEAQTDGHLYTDEEIREIVEYIERLAACRTEPTACTDVVSVTTTLETGEEATVVEIPDQGLCLVVDGERVVCDAELDVGTGPDTDPSTARLGIAPCCPPIWFGYLPDGARAGGGVATLLTRADGTGVAASGAATDRLWVMPVPADVPEPETTRVEYHWMADGQIVPAPRAGVPLDGG